MSFRKLLLTLFLSLMLYAQAYSLVVGLQSATILNPERLEDMQDTDLEDIVTFDKKPGVGLANVRARLRLHFGAASFVKLMHAGSETALEIRLPYQPCTGETQCRTA